MNENVKCKHCGTVNNVYNGVCSNCGYDLDVTASETMGYDMVDSNMDYKEFNRYSGFTSELKDETTTVQKAVDITFKVVGLVLLFVVSLIPIIGQLVVSISNVKTSTKTLLITLALMLYVIIIGLEYAVSKDIIDLIGKGGTEVTLWEYILEFLPTSR